MTYVSINGTLYPATIKGSLEDVYWDRRDSKSITVEMDYATAAKLFINGLSWSIVHEEEVAVYEENEHGELLPVLDAEGNQTYETKQTVFDNSEYCVAGSITDTRDGNMTIKMGKPTDLENAYEMIYGGF